MSIQQQEGKKTIGVWLELQPRQPLTSEGIGRLLRFFIEGGTARGYQFLFGCGSWYKADLHHFINELPPECKGSISVMTARTQPHTCNQFGKVKAKPRKRRPGKLFFRLRRWQRAIMRWSCEQPAPVVWLVVCLLWPVALVAGMSITLASAKAFFRRSKHPIILLLKRSLSRVRGLYISHLSFLQNQMHKVAVELEYQQLARLASERQDVACWYIPNPRFAFSRLIEKPKVVSFPDYVIEDFPLSFKFEGGQKMPIQKTLSRADCTISFRDYVREKHVVDVFKFPAERAFVVPHAPVDLSRYIRELAESPSTSKDSEFFRRLAAEKIRAHCAKQFIAQQEEYPLHASYLPDFPFEDTCFVLVSTQWRGYKNVQRVVQAVELLIRKRYVDIKLFITGGVDKETADYIADRGLGYDVIPLHRVPADVHAYVYHLAAVAVHPSYFEGGFPFVFSEALSVATPALLADVEVNREVLHGAEHKQYLFDPYSETDLADKIEYVLTHRTEVLARQTAILTEMRKRSWADVAQEYLRVVELAVEFPRKGRDAFVRPQSLSLSAPVGIEQSGLTAHRG